MFYNLQNNCLLSINKLQKKKKIFKPQCILFSKVDYLLKLTVFNEDSYN